MTETGVAAMNTTERRDFIASLSLFEPMNSHDGRVDVEPRNSQAAGYLVKDSLISFPEGVSAQHQTDVIHSTLLAQLAADKKYDRRNDAENWYKFYAKTLTTVGWVAQDFEFTNITANRIVVSLLTDISGDLMAIISETLSGFENQNQQNNSLVTLRTSEATLGNGNFQVAIATESNGIVIMKIGAFYLDNIYLQVANRTINLNESVYGQVREAIRQKLETVDYRKYLSRLR
jgi:hypothetical protein